MNWLLMANNFTSVTLVITCWWLSHQYARVDPPGRSIAIGLGALGFSTLLTLVARNIGVPVQWPIVATKTILSACLILIIIRRTKKGDD